jgi:hypothetical protein
MTSTFTYKEIKPTYLYIKQHSVTGLKYFGKTTSPDPINYLGSGVYWNRHIKKHGKQFVETIWLSDLYYDTSIREPALHFSCENNIDTTPTIWANLILEDGLTGGSRKGRIRSVETVKKYSDAHANRTPEQKAATSKKISETMSNKSPEEKAAIFKKMSETMSNKSPEEKAAANARRSTALMGKKKGPRSVEAKANMSAAQIGKKRSAESIAKGTETRKANVAAKQPLLPQGTVL